MSSAHIAKGRALEQAVKFIQETILNSSPDLKGTNFTIETNVHDKSSGVHHEIDVLVRTHPKSDYEATWIFECKNWAKSVDKNEIIVLAEKVEALRASRGFIVAKSLTKEALAQLERTKRLEFIRCTEDFLSPLNSAQIIHSVTELLPISLQIKDRNFPPSPDLQILDWRTLSCRFEGKQVDFMSYIKPHIDNLVYEDNNKNRAKHQYSGTHWGQVAAHINFLKDEFMMGKIDVEYIAITLRFFVKTCRKKILAKFELENRGRSYSFEPIEDFVGGKPLEIHLVQRL